MIKTTNKYCVSSWIEVQVCEDAGRRVFVVVNTLTGLGAQISKWAAMAMCITPDSTITADNWEYFCTGRED